MKTKILIYIFILFGSSSQKENSKWTNLLDKNLSQWDSYLSFPFTSMNIQGPPVDDNGDTLKPIGLNKDPKQVFTMLEENGEDVLRISGEIYGCIATKKEFENYHFSFQVKWGEKKWPPRLNEYRDSGICYHSVGDFGVDYWLSWMQSQELQIGEGWFGDYWSIAGSRMDIRASKPEGQDAYQFDPSAPLKNDRNSSSYCMRINDFEKPFGEWNTVELICFGDKSIYIINGHVAMALENSRMIKDGKEVPLTKGKIQIQSEAAEVYYKNIKIRQIDHLPEVYSQYFE